MAREGRLPDFLLIGVAKCGTTSLAASLGEQHEILMSDPKEPMFFSHDDNWARGIDAYGRLFSSAREGQLAGEASTTYTHPDRCHTSAERIQRTIPDARLICLMRHPVDRIRSHYRARRLTGKESRSLLEALAKPGNTYLRHSQYHACLLPYLDRFPDEQLCLVRTEDLGSLGWTAILRHLGLSERTSNARHLNVSAELGQEGTVLRRVGASAWWRTRGSHVPKPLRRLGRRLLAPRRGAYDTTLEVSRASIPTALLDPLWEDISKLEDWMGTERLWDRTEGGAPELDPGRGEHVG